MFRLLAWLIGLALGAFIVAAFLLFTATGNGLLQPLTEKALQSKLPQARVSVLDIRPDHANLTVQLSQDTQFTLSAKTELFAGKAIGTWQASCKDLTQLSRITPIPLAGAASSDGNFDLSPAQQQVIAKLALGISQLNLQLSHQQSSAISLNAQGKLLVSEITQLLQQPELINGHVQVVAQLKLDNWHDKHSLNGTIGSNMTDGLLKAQSIQEVTGITLPSNTPFSLNSTTDILNGKSLSQALLNSPLATIGLTNLRYNIGDDGFTSDHQTQIQDLNKLRFITSTPLHGRAQINGSLTYTQPTHQLILNASSHLLGGKINLKINGDQLSAQLTDVQTTELENMLAMPVVFKSTLNGDIIYDIKTQQGKFDSTLYEGQILPNEFSTLLNNTVKFDITHELYQQAQINGIIHAETVSTNLDLQSHLTHLTASNARIDLKEQKINAELIAQIKGIAIPVQIRGDLTAPSIASDLSAILSKDSHNAVQETVETEKQRLVDQIKQQLGIPQLGH